MSKFPTQRYEVLDSLLAPPELSALRELLSAFPQSTRRVLENSHVAKFADTLRDRTSYLKGLIPVQATFFLKTAEKNWFVAPHQDLVIPVMAHHAKSGWRNPTVKDGVPFIEPPESILEKCVALRIQLDPPQRGDLRLIIDDREIDPEVGLGSALLMSPLLVHASSKLGATQSRRRVLHILYGPAELPEPFHWYGYAA